MFYMLARYASPSGPLCLRCLMLTLSVPMKLLFLHCFIASWTCVVVSVIVCLCCVFDCVAELFVECVCYLCG